MPVALCVLGISSVCHDIATSAAVPPRDLAAALRGAGLTGVDDSARRRAEYSADASNYRVVPSVVVFPRHVDEAAAALDVARRAGVPVTSRGAGTSIAGNAIGSGVVLDFSKHLNRVLSVDPETRTAVERAVHRLLFKWLNRRSQRRSFSWERFCQYLKRHPLPQPGRLVRLNPVW
jgi:hypothetical protein